MIQPLGEWILRRVFADVEDWRRDGLQPVPVSVNVSASQVSDLLRSRLASLIEGGAARPEDIGIELTESAPLAENEDSQRVIRSIREMGFKVSIDDFGTGYSSFEYLRRFEVDVIKVDRSFLQGVPHDQENCGLTRAAIAVGRALGLHTIAEGCETEEQLAFLREVGCDMVQGHLFSQAVPVDAFKKLIVASNRRGGVVL